MNYRLAYAIGFHPWEDLAEHPPFAGTLLELVAREEAGREPPHGPALDLGTAARSGRTARPARLAGDRRRHRREGAAPRPRADRRGRRRDALVRGDVTALRRADVGSGFRLVLDTGTFHGLSDAQRAAMGREVSAIAAPDATVLLDCFAPRAGGRCRVARAAPPSRRPSPDGR